MDFTLLKYTELIQNLISEGYSFQTFADFLSGDKASHKIIILRHDVDLLPYNSLKTAEIEAKLGISGVYYFRAVPESWNEDVICKISELGHEVGYHYENLTTCNGDIDAAYTDFCKNLNNLRQLVDVNTICMHGSPRSPFDSKDIWKKYSYKDLEILGEPYFDVDFGDFFYLTDTGRRWDGYKVSVRDRIQGYSEVWQKEGKTFHSTNDILKALHADKLPNKIMITVHPQRWNPVGIKWGKELIMQNIKNIVKQAIIKTRH